MLQCRHFPADARFTLLHVTPSDVTEAADAASIGLFGRGFPGRKPNPSFDDIADDEASSLLAAAADRLGHPNVEMVSRRGRVEREVVVPWPAVSMSLSWLVMATARGSGPGAWVTRRDSSSTTRRAR